MTQLRDVPSGAGRRRRHFAADQAPDPSASFTSTGRDRSGLPDQLRGACGTLLQRKCCTAAMEHANMASDDQKDQREGSEREQRKNVRSPPVSAGPPILNDGLELPRSNDC